MKHDPLSKLINRNGSRHFTIGKRLCLALGLNPKRTADFSIHVPVSGTVRVRAELLLNRKQGEAVMRVLRDFEVRIVRKGKTEAAA